VSNTQEQSPTGPAYAAILAAAIGCIAFGISVDVAEAFPAVSKKLNLYNPTGDLSGKSTLAVIVWIIAWSILQARWKNRTIGAVRSLCTVIVVLIVLTLLATFPPLFGML
jgi:hypothetical protein